MPDLTFAVESQLPKDEAVFHKLNSFETHARLDCLSPFCSQFWSPRSPFGDEISRPRETR
jgi:hypothetical protein